MHLYLQGHHYNQDNEHSQQPQTYPVPLCKPLPPDSCLFFLLHNKTPRSGGGGLFCFCHSRLISRVSHTENHRVSIPLGAGFIQAPTEGHLDCCQLGAIRSKAALNIPVHVFVRTYISLTAGKYPDVRGVNHIHYVVCTFNTFKKPPSFFPRFLGHVTFPQTIQQISSCYTTWPTLGMVPLASFSAILPGAQRQLIVTLTHTSLVTNENFPVFISRPYIFFGEVPVTYLVHFLPGYLFNY